MGVEQDAPEGVLLERFATAGDASAFEELVRRHGPVVLDACRRILRSDADAEDAFQAVFVVLARRARGIDGSRPLGPWLYGVAVRIALDLRSSRRTRQERERRAAGMRRAGPTPESEVRSILDEEIEKLPDRYRSPFILCTLEGKTNDAAARALGCPRGTVSTRLGKAREMLRSRLLERGVAVTGGVFAALLAGGSVPPGLAHAAAQAATGQAAVTAQVGMLVHGGMKAMTLLKAKVATVWMAAILTGSSLAAAAYLAEPQSRSSVASDEAKRGYEKLSALLRPLPGEYDWRDSVPWHTRIQAARRQAVKEDKPLLIFSCANAFVLGRT